MKQTLKELRALTRQIAALQAVLITFFTAHAQGSNDSRPGLQIPGHRLSSTVTFSGLLEEMSDPSCLAHWQDNEWVSKQVSALRLDKRHTAGFFAEKEIGNYIRLEQNENGQPEVVLMEDKGPGAIVRIWFGNVEGNTNATVRLYLDGNAKPSIVSRWAAFGSGEDFIKPPFSANTARGANVYLPIPYAKSCKFTVENGKDLFYVIQYRSYSPQTRIQTFDRSQYDHASQLLDKTAASLLRPTPNPDGLRTLMDQSLAPRTSTELTLKRGSRAIDLLALKLEAKDMKAALRTTFLTLTFDGHETVHCPVGDFFGSGLGLNPLEDWMRSVKPSGEMSCRWVMPYQKTARLKILCAGDEPVKISASLHYRTWKWDGRSMYFHSNWGISEKLGILPRPNFNFIKIQGQGIYAGDTLTITTDSKLWWGEGPEKISIDGEGFPSHIGTGTEDYYGYSYGERALFCAPFHAQNKIPEGPHWLGTTVNTRIRSLDAIPFKESLDLDLEIQTHDSNGKVQKFVDYAVATYWYGFANTTGNWRPEPVRMKNR